MRSPSGLLNATRYLLAHPDVAEAVGASGAEFVRTHLTPEAIDCVWAYYAVKLAELDTGPATLADGAVNVTGHTVGDLEGIVHQQLWSSLPRPSAGATRSAGATPSAGATLSTGATRAPSAG